MKTCHECGQRLWHKQLRTPTGEHGRFKIRYACSNGHTGTVEGQVGQDETEWTHTGEVFGPSVRADSPEATQ